MTDQISPTLLVLPLETLVQIARCLSDGEVFTAFRGTCRTIRDACDIIPADQLWCQLWSSFTFVHDFKSHMLTLDTRFYVQYTLDPFKDAFPFLLRTCKRKYPTEWPEPEPLVILPVISLRYSPAEDLARLIYSYFWMEQPLQLVIHVYRAFLSYMKSTDDTNNAARQLTRILDYVSIVVIEHTLQSLPESYHNTEDYKEQKSIVSSLSKRFQWWVMPVLEDCVHHQH